MVQPNFYIHGKFSSVTQSCLTLCDPMDYSMPGFPVHYQLLELAQTHVHRVGDAIQPSHPLLLPSPALNLPQHHSLFQLISSSHQVAKVLEHQLQHQSFQWIFRVSINIQEYSIIHSGLPLAFTCLISLKSKGLSGVFSNTTIQKHQFFSTQLSLWFNSHIHTGLLGKTIALTRWTFVGKVISLLFNMLSRLVITFLPRTKPLLISC